MKQQAAGSLLLRRAMTAKATRLAAEGTMLDTLSGYSSYQSRLRR
jgi:hypothetical protein